jgi:hypothetical protein
MATRRPRRYARIIAGLEERTAHLQRLLADGSFYRLPYWRRFGLVWRIKSLYSGLVGPFAGGAIKPYVAASSLLLLAAACETTFLGYEVDLLAFGPPQTNPLGLAQANEMAAPAFADIDADGDLDAFVGGADFNSYPYNAEITYYENVGSAEAPPFGTAVADPFGLFGSKYRAAPVFVDIDADGDLDALVGTEYYDGYSWTNGAVLLRKNVGTPMAPNFDPPVLDPFGLQSVDTHAWPAFADIDDDGDLDALIGDAAGDFIFSRNTGTPQAPVFAAPQSNPFGLAGVGSYASPALADLDGDGDLDLLAGSGDPSNVSDLHFFENVGTPSDADFAAPITNPFGLQSGYGSAATALVDIDADADVDLFVGGGRPLGSTADITFFENETF